MQDIKVKFAYKTGFRRLWLVISVIWLICTVAVVYDYGNPVQYFLVAGLAPVIVLYLLGVAFVWIIEGFARADR